MPSKRPAQPGPSSGLTDELKNLNASLLAKETALRLARNIRETNVLEVGRAKKAESEAKKQVTVWEKKLKASLTEVKKIEKDVESAEATIKKHKSAHPNIKFDQISSPVKSLISIAEKYKLPLCYESGELMFSEDDAGGGVECELEATVRLETYHTNDVSGPRGSNEKPGLVRVENTAAEELEEATEPNAKRSKPSMKSKKAIKNQKPLLTAGQCKSWKIDQALSTNKAQPVDILPTQDDVLKAVFRALNFGDDNCLGHILMGASDYEMLSEAKPSAASMQPTDVLPQIHSRIPDDYDSFSILKRHLCETLKIDSVFAAFLKRQEGRRCMDITCRLLKDEKERKKNRISHANTIRKLAVEGVTAEGVQEVMILQVEFQFSGTISGDCFDDDDW